MASVVRNSQSLIILFLFLLQSNRQQHSSAVSSESNHRRFARHHRHRSPPAQANRTGCSLFAGTWVRDETYPLYQPSDCPNIIDPEFDCQTYGRPDSDYLKFRWQPFNCELPRFNGLEFLVRMRGKTVMFVGDSLGRNQWESLICMISAYSPSIQTQMIRQDPLSIFRFLDYGLTVSFHRAPYLVDIDVVNGKRVLRLDEISRNADTWREADVLLFNTGHWWSHKGPLQGWDTMEREGRCYRDMDRLVALERGIRTWSHWVDHNVDRSKTRVFFQSISPTHYNPSEWTSRTKATTTASATKNCYGETSPLSGSDYPCASYVGQMRVISEAIKQMNFPTFLMDVSLLSGLRKDGHPSIYSGDLSPSQRQNPDRSADCSHWCLPGLPDTWNQLFYAALLY